MPQVEVTYGRRAPRTTTTITLVGGRRIEFPGDLRAEDIAAVLKRRRERRRASIEADMRSPDASVRLDALRRKRAMLAEELRSIERQKVGR